MEIKKLVEELLGRGFTQSELAKEIGDGFEQSTISKIKRGVNKDIQSAAFIKLLKLYKSNRKSPKAKRAKK